MDWRRSFRLSLYAGQLMLVLRLATGLVLFRLLSGYLSEQQFGYYAWLWSIFPTTILLDFGVGLAAQKLTAQRYGTSGQDELNQYVTTAFWSFAALGAVLAGAGILLTPTLLVLLQLPPTTEFVQCWWLFAFSLGLMFPLGLLAEVMTGAQKGYVPQFLGCLAILLNLVLLMAGCSLGWDLRGLLMSALLPNLLPGLVMVAFLPRFLPGLSLSWRHFRPARLRQELRFSLLTYISSVANLAFTRSDQTIIALTLGAAAIGPYQASFKLAELYGTAWGVLLAPLGAASGHLAGKGDRVGLRRLVLAGQRATLTLGLPLALAAALSARPLLSLLVGRSSYVNQGESLAVVLLLAAFLQLYFWGPAQASLVMCGYERPLAQATALGAVANIGLSCLGARTWGLLGVALATLAASLLRGGWVYAACLSPFLRLRLGATLRACLDERLWAPLAVALLLPRWNPVVAWLILGPLALTTARRLYREALGSGDDMSEVSYLHLSGCDVTVRRESGAFRLFLYHPGGWSRTAVARDLQSQLAEPLRRRTRYRLRSDELNVDAQTVELSGKYRGSMEPLVELARELVECLGPHLLPLTGCRLCGASDAAMAPVRGAGLMICPGCRLPLEHERLPAPRYKLGLAWLVATSVLMICFGSSLEHVWLRKIAKISLLAGLFVPRLVWGGRYLRTLSVQPQGLRAELATLEPIDSPTAGFARARLHYLLGDPVASQRELERIGALHPEAGQALDTWRKTGTACR